MGIEEIKSTASERVARYNRYDKFNFLSNERNIELIQLGSLEEKMNRNLKIKRTCSVEQMI